MECCYSYNQFCRCEKKFVRDKISAYFRLHGKKKAWIHRRGRHCGTRPPNVASHFVPKMSISSGPRPSSATAHTVFEITWFTRCSNVMMELSAARSKWCRIHWFFGSLFESCKAASQGTPVSSPVAYGQNVLRSMQWLVEVVHRSIISACYH